MPLEIIDEIRPRKEERSAFRTIASYAIGLLSLIALLVAVSWPTKAHADTPSMVYSDQQITLRLLLKPCTAAAVLKHLPAQEHPAYREAVFVYDGRTLACCWRERGNAVRTMDEEGDRLVPDVPQELFKPDAGV